MIHVLLIGLSIMSLGCTSKVIAATNIIASEDTYIHEAFPNSNYKTSTMLYVGYESEPYQTSEVRGLVKFDLSSYSAITSAVFYIYCYGYLGSDSVSIGCHEATSAWDDDTVTWNTNNPSFTSTPEASVSVSAGSTWHSFTITSLAQSWISSTNYGVVLKHSGADSGERANFIAIDYSQSTYHPYLSVEGTVPEFSDLTLVFLMSSFVLVVVIVNIKTRSKRK